MMPTVVSEQAPVPPPAYHRAQARVSPALHIDALTLVRTLHLLTFCHLAVQLAHRRCPPPLPAGPGGAPRTYRQESLLLLALLVTTGGHAFPVPPNSASAVRLPERRDPRHSSS